MSAFMPLLLGARGAAGGPAFTASAMTVLSSRILLGSLPNQLGPRKTLLGGIAIMAAGFSLLLVSHIVAMSVLSAAAGAIGNHFGLVPVFLFAIANVTGALLIVWRTGLGRAEAAT